MKKIKMLMIAALAAFAGTAALSAQDDLDCMSYLSFYQEYYNQKTKESKLAALPSWRKAYRLCEPATRQNLYVHGADIYRLLIARNSNNPEYKAALLDTLFTLHKLRAQYYPKYADKAYAAFSADINNYLRNDPVMMHQLASEIVSGRGAAAAPVTFVALMNSAVALYKAGKLTADEVINDYDTAVNCFTELQKTDTTQMTRNLRTTFENAFINSQVASCDNLITLFGPRFEQNKGDYDQVNKIVRMLSRNEDCIDSDLFMQAVTTMHALKPNANSAYFLYRLHASKQEIDKAIRYLEEACSSDELDNATKAQYTYELSVMCLKNGNYTKSVSAAKESVSLDPALAGKAYMIIGQAWMSVGCGGNDIERRAKYWVASDYFDRARAADSSLAEEVSRQKGICSTYFPATAEAFMYDVQNGQNFTISCGGMSATTVVRTK